MYLSVGSESSFEVPVTMEIGGECIEFGLTDTIGTVCQLFQSEVFLRFFFDFVQITIIVHVLSKLRCNL